MEVSFINLNLNLHFCVVIQNGVAVARAFVMRKVAANCRSCLRVADVFGHRIVKFYHKNR